MNFWQGLVLGVLIGHAIGAIVMFFAVLGAPKKEPGKEWFAIVCVMVIWPLFFYDILRTWYRKNEVR